MRVDLRRKVDPLAFKNLRVEPIAPDARPQQNLAQESEAFLRQVGSARQKSRIGYLHLRRHYLPSADARDAAPKSRAVHLFELLGYGARAGVFRGSPAPAPTPAAPPSSRPRRVRAPNQTCTETLLNALVRRTCTLTPPVVVLINSVWVFAMLFSVEIFFEFVQRKTQRDGAAVWAGIFLFHSLALFQQVGDGSLA